MKIGSTYRWYDMRPDNWFEQAESMGLRREDADVALRSFVRALPELATRVAAEVEQQGMGHPVIGRLVVEIEKAAARCGRMLAPRS